MSKGPSKISKEAKSQEDQAFLDSVQSQNSGKGAKHAVMNNPEMFEAPSRPNMIEKFKSFVNSCVKILLPKQEGEVSKIGDLDTSKQHNAMPADSFNGSDSKDDIAKTGKTTKAEGPKEAPKPPAIK